MPSKAIPLSPAVAHLLRERREALGMTLRAVELVSREHGNPIPNSTLARIESGKLDPGVRRLQQLLRIYGLPIQAAGDLLDLEEFAGATPLERDPLKLRDLSVAAWREGRVADALASFLAFRERALKSDAPRAVRQEAMLSFAVAAASLGKHHLARHLLEDLLLESPEPNVTVALLVQMSSVWTSLGSPVAASAFIEKAATYVRPGAHRHAGWIDHQRALILIGQKKFDEARRSLKVALANHRRANSPRDEAVVLMSFCRLAFEQGDGAAAVAAALRAIEFTRRHRFARLHSFSQIEQARGLQLLEQWSQSRQILRGVLADTLVAEDNVVPFYAHYYLWKAELAGGDPARADIELQEAAYFVRFVDQSSAEVIDVRSRIGSSAKKRGR